MQEVLSEWLEVSVGASPLGTDWIVVSRDFAPRLTTRHDRVFEIVARRTVFGDEEFTNDLPVESEPLGKDGLIPVGTDVKPGDLLVGKVTPKGEMALSPEEKLLRGIFGEKATEVRDSSLRVPPHLYGEVVESAFVPKENKGEVARARVVIAWECNLTVGDVLLCGERRATVCDIRGSDNDVLYDYPSSTIHIAKVALAQDLIHARSIGPYSLVTQQPLGGRESFGGQPITQKQAALLIAGGGRWMASEMFTIKSNAVIGRVRAYESLVQRENPDPFTNRGLFSEAEEEGEKIAPVESAIVLKREMQALGFLTSWSERKVVSRWLGSDAIREQSHGEITRPETINYRTYKPEKSGLFCDLVFGPVNDYECSCRALSGVKNRGRICDKCSVECGPSVQRRERFGHIELCVPLLHPFCITEAALLLDWEPDDIERLATAQTFFVNGDLQEEGEINQTGGAALRSLLQAIDLDEIEAMNAGDRADLAFAMMKQDLAPDTLVLDALPVLPPDLRPLVPLDGGRFATSDLNDLYRRVINRNNRLRRLLELNAPEIIVRNEILQLFEAVVALFHNERSRRVVTGPDRQRLRSLGGMIADASSNSLLNKRVDYSGCAMLVVDPSLSAGTCRLPFSMARELFKPMVYGVLEEQGHVTSIKAAKQMVETEQEVAVLAIEQVSQDYPVLLMAEDRLVTREVSLWDWPAIAVDEKTADRLGPGAVSVHVPLTEEARAECQRFTDMQQVREPVLSGWFTRLLSGDVEGALVRASIHGEVDALRDEVVMTALGYPPQT